MKGTGFYTYFIRCMDDSLYCGYTTDIIRRNNEHKKGIGSKYVRSRGYKKLEMYVILESKSLAMKLEKSLKKLSKEKKEMLIKGDESILQKQGIDYISVNF